VPEGLNRSINYRKQSNYFAKARYRNADDPVVAAYALPKLDFIESAVPLAQTTVLDVGCGNGVFTHYLKDRCKSLAALDFSANMLAENPFRALVQADAGSLPFKSGSFDVTFEANLLHHADSPRQVVLEMARVAGRWVVLLEPNRNNPVMFAFGLAVKAERASLKSCPSGLRKLLSDCGLAIRLSVCTGMISQNNTPAFLVPFLRYFDRQFPLGEYVITVGEKETADLARHTANSDYDARMPV
jgi:SAM-dependent methyltransferase